MTEPLSEPGAASTPPPGADPMSVLASVLDDLLDTRVLVQGPSPAAPRLITVYAGARELAALAVGLRAAGYMVRGDVWAAFDAPGPRAVRLRPTSALPASDALLAGASPVPGRRRLVAARGDRAPLLESRPRRRHARSATIPTVVSISGPDGTGKSTQVAALRDAFESIGFPVAVGWAPTITRKRSFSPPARSQGVLGSTAAAQRTLARRVLEHGWATLMALRNAAEMWRHVLRARGASTLLLDRFSLDAGVKLEYWYGHRRGLNLTGERRLFELVAPRAAVAVLLVVPIERNRSRRPDDWSSDELAVFWRLYRRAAGAARAVVIDADRPVHEVARDVARSVWQGLP